MKRPYWHTIELKGADDNNFEKALLNWVNIKVRYYSKSILVFNYKFIKADSETASSKCNKRACNTELGGIKIRYLRVTESMCILLKVTKNCKQLYKIPDTWEDADFWYMY